MINVDKVYVLHYTKLKERRENIEKSLNHFGIDYELVTAFDQEDLSKEVIDPSATTLSILDDIDVASK